MKTSKCSVPALFILSRRLIQASKSEALHPVKGLLKNGLIADRAESCLRFGDPFALESILGRTINFKEDAENARKRQAGEPVSGKFVITSWRA